MCPLAGVGLICVLFARKYTLKRNFVKAGEQRPGSSGSTDGTNPSAGKDGESSGKVTPESDKVAEGAKEKVDKHTNV